MPANTMTTVFQSGGTKNGVLLAGALRDVYSNDIKFHAQPLMVFSQFMEKITDLTTAPGDTIKFTRYNDLVGNADLSEVERVPLTNMSASQFPITVKEYGYGLAFSIQALRNSWDSIMGRATMLLGQHYARHTDGLARREFLASGSNQTLLAKAGAVTRAGLDATSASKLNVSVIKDAVELLATNKAPRLPDGTYGCIIHPHQSRGLRDDTAWIDAHKYANPGNLYRGEIGMIEGVRFFETTNTEVIKAVTGVVHVDGKATTRTEPVVSATTDVYRACIFGASAVGWADSMPVEIRDSPSDDFGRDVKLAWLAVHGTGAVNPEFCAVIETN